MSTDTVLASIDDTLAGYHGAVFREGDAMRWSPERVICDGGGPLALEPAMARPIRVTPLPAIVGPLLDGLHETLAAQVFSYLAYGLAYGSPPGLPLHPDVLRRTGGLVRPPWHLACGWRRCRTCNPHGNPAPCAIDHREYHRRQKARQRRKAR